MSAHSPRSNSTPVDFEQRLKLVRAEVETRIAKKHPTNPCAMRASLWVKWLSEKVLGEVSHA
jgi:hypothetical protein